MANPKLTFNVALRRYARHTESLAWSPEWQRVVFVFLNRLEALTIQSAQERGLQHWHDPRVNAIDDEVIDNYFASYRDKSQATRNNSITAIKGFLNWLKDTKQIKRNDCERWLSGRMTKPKNRKPKQYIPAGDFPQALDLSGQRHAADRAAFAVALYTLCRQGEIKSIQLQDIDFDKRVIQVYRSKRQRWTEVPICDELQVELARWLTAYADLTDHETVGQMRQEHPNWHLIPKLAYERNSGPYDAALVRYTLKPSEPSSGLQNVVKRVLDGLGVEGSEHTEWSRHLGEGMHTVRRSGARAMLDHLAKKDGNDKALLQVSIMLDHDEPKVTLLYIGVNIERDRLHDYLKGGGSMYGSGDSGHKVTEGSNVIAFRPRKIG